MGMVFLLQWKEEQEAIHLEQKFKRWRKKMISEILLGLILIVLIFIAVMVYAIGDKISEK